MKIGILVLVAILLVVLLYYISPPSNKKKPAKEGPKKELYAQKLNKSGVYILYNLLKNSSKVDSLRIINDPIDNSLSSNLEETPQVYVLIDNNFTVSDTAIDVLKKFVKNGNHAFISLENYSLSFSYIFSRSKLNGVIQNQNGVSLEMTHDSLKMDFAYFLQQYRQEYAVTRNWNYFRTQHFYEDKNSLVILGRETYNNRPVFVKVPYGNGYFYFHSVPEAFYNESMFNEDGFEYAQAVFSNLPKGNYIWHNHLNEWDENEIIDPDNQEDFAETRESPIQYILEDERLRFAYLLLLFSLIVYVIFKSKRKQQIIPTVEPNQNNSLEFVETVSRLYLKQDKHYKFIKHYEQSFIQFIKDKYYISSPTINEDYVKSIALKSGIGEDLIFKIFNEIKKAKKSYTYTSDQLIALHKKIEYFYKHCK